MKSIVSVNSINFILYYFKFGIPWLPTNVTMTLYEKSRKQGNSPLLTAFKINSLEKVLNITQKKHNRKTIPTGERGTRTCCQFSRWENCKEWSPSNRRSATAHRAVAFRWFKSLYPQTQKKTNTERCWSFSGRGTRTWTLSLRFWRPPLYQLSYTPIF